MFNEVHTLHGHTLLLITKPSLQASALLQHLKSSLSVNGKLHNIQRSLDEIAGMFWCYSIWSKRIKSLLITGRQA